jgi:hypothetical protein
MENTTIEKQVELHEFCVRSGIRYDDNGIKTIVTPKIHGYINLLSLDEIKKDNNKEGLIVISELIDDIDNKFINADISAESIKEYGHIVYRLIGTITDVIMDVDEKDFVKVLNTNTNDVLKDFIKDIFNHSLKLRKDLVEFYNSIKKAQDMGKLPKKSKLEEKKDAFNVIEKAYNDEKDTKLKKQYLLQIAKLTEEIDALEKEGSEKNNTTEDGNENEIGKINNVKLSDIGLNNDNKVININTNDIKEDKE